MTYTIGIDPGLTGAVAGIGPDGTVKIIDIPTTAVQGGMVGRRVDGRALALALRDMYPAGCTPIVLLERVGAMGGKNNAIQTQVSLGRTLGAIEAVLDVLRLSPVMVSPQAWQATFALKGKKQAPRAKGELPAATKIARTLYPQAASLLSRVMDHNKAEALLIAHHGRSTLA